MNEISLFTKTVRFCSVFSISLQPNHVCNLMMDDATSGKNPYRYSVTNRIESSRPSKLHTGLGFGFVSINFI